MTKKLLGQLCDCFKRYALFDHCATQQAEIDTDLSQAFWDSEVTDQTLKAQLHQQNASRR